MSKAAISRQVMTTIIEHMSEAPITQATDAVRLSFVDALNKLDTMSDVEMYDLIQRTSTLPCPIDISSFVRALCDLDPHYDRPSG